MEGVAIALAEAHTGAGPSPRTPARLRSADAFRALATVWVIVIHTSHWVSGDFYVGLDLVARFAVPAFVVLTGVLLGYRHGGAPLDRRSFLLRRLARTLVPWLAWAPVYVAYGLLVSGDPTRSLHATWVFLYWGAGHLWFLLLVPQLYLVYLVWPRRHLALAACLALALQTALAFLHLYAVLPDGVPQSLLQPHAFQLFPFWVGYLGVGILAGRVLATRGEPDHVSARAVLLCLVAVTCAGWLQVQRFAGVSGDLQSGTGAFVLPQEPLLVLAIGALVLAAGPSLLARHARLAHLVGMVADNSLGIYILHPVLVYVVGRRLSSLLSPAFPQSLPGLVLLTVAGLVCATVLARLVSATPLAATVGTPRRPLRRRVTTAGTASSANA